MDVAIPLVGTAGLFALVHHEDLHLVRGNKWHPMQCTARGHVNHTAYAVSGRNIFMHHLILAPPDGLQVDHRNGNGLDNRRGNLRIATPQQNRANCGKHANASSRFKGVGWHKPSGSWQAGIKFNGRRIHLGHFDEELTAALAYDAKAVQLFGEFAKTNFQTEAAR